MPNEPKSFRERVLEPAIVGIIGTLVGGVLLAFALAWYGPSKPNDNGGNPPAPTPSPPIIKEDNNENIHRQFWKMNVQ